MRRMVISSAAHVMVDLRALHRAGCRMMGITRLLQTMIDSATASTMTMAVAAESPPRKAMRAKVLAAGGDRQRQHESVAIGDAGAEGA